MKTTMLVRSVALLLLGAVAASHAQPAAADAPPLDFPPACLALLLDQYYSAPPGLRWEGFTSPLPVVGDKELGESVALWRVGCGSSDAVLQMRLGFTDPLVDPQVSMPRLTVRQNGREVDIQALRVTYPNLGQAPVLIPAGTARSSPGMFVLSSGGERVDLKGALTILVRNPVTGAVALALDIPAYAPAPTLMPLSGRLVGNFYDEAKSGEGILVEIGDVGPPQLQVRQRHYLQFSWFTYDNDGRPFWISGGAEFLDGDTHLHMPAIFRGGGRFAGLKAATEITSWGTVDMEFADCNTLRIGYNANTGLPSNVPSGSGQLEWHRLTRVSGYRCD